MIHAAESTHYYRRDGSPAYEVESAKGGMRPTTLRDARKLGLVPSVTTIIKCAAAPGLEVWKQNQVLMAALTLSRRHGEPEERYIARIVEDSREQARKAAERGTAIHAAIQGHYEGTPPPEEFWPHVRGAVEALERWHQSWPCWKGEWPEFAEVQAEASFASKMGYGGKMDLWGHAPSWIVDFKTKEFGPDEELKTWDEQAQQLSAYRMGIGIKRAKCAIVYVSATHPGLARLIEIPEEDLLRGWECFQSLLTYWQAKNRYNSAFTPEELVAA